MRRRDLVGTAQIVATAEAYVTAAVAAAEAAAGGVVDLVPCTGVACGVGRAIGIAAGAKIALLPRSPGSQVGTVHSSIGTPGRSRREVRSAPPPTPVSLLLALPRSIILPRLMDRDVGMGTRANCRPSTVPRITVSSTEFVYCCTSAPCVETLGVANGGLADTADLTCAEVVIRGQHWSQWACRCVRVPGRPLMRAVWPAVEFPPPAWLAKWQLEPICNDTGQPGHTRIAGCGGSSIFPWTGRTCGVIRFSRQSPVAYVVGKSR
mmetsp:Transcript_4789/g.11669  ORF Transcript_4789/g.11669 Transcript_4789/m.11669 type:complete len:264 (+) Transcript_4789:312-1103(+)